MRLLQWFVLSASVLAVGCGGSIELAIPPEKIQENIDSYFPFTIGEDDEDSPAEIVLTEPQLILTENSDTVGFECAVQIAPKDQPPGPPAGAPPIPSPPFGDPAAGPQPPKPEPLRGMVGISGKLTYQAEEKAFYLGEAVVHRLDAKSPQGEKMPERLDQQVRAAAGQALRKYLDEQAIYKLEGDSTGVKAAQMLLRSVTVRDGNLIVELGPN